MDALEQARKVLSARITDPKAKFLPGLTDDLRAILGAFDEIERRIGTLAHLAILSHTDAGKPHPGVLQTAATFSDSAGAMYRIATHGDRCNCEQCWGRVK